MINKFLKAEESQNSDVDVSEEAKSNTEEGVYRYSDEECAQLARFVDKNYSKLFGKLSGPSYKAVKDKTWRRCVETINAWHVERKNEHKGKIVERDEDSIKRKFENLKKRGKYKTLKFLNNSGFSNSSRADRSREKNLCKNFFGQHKCVPSNLKNQN